MSLFDEEAGQDEISGIVQFAFLRRPLADLVDACAASSLDLIVLKGAALAETVYPRPSLRPFGDIDVLVRAEDAARACALLSELGYTAEAGAQADLIREHSCEANFFRDTERGSVVVELHTDLINNPLLLPQFHVDLAGLWQRAQPAYLAGQPALVLGPEDQILHLCLHLAGHYFDAPRSLQDIAQVCAHADGSTQPLDWTLFLQLAEESHSKAACFCGLFAAKSLLSAPVPAEVMDALAPNVRSSARRRLETLTLARLQNADQTEHLRFPLLWWLMENRQTRLSALRRIVFPAPSWLIQHYYYDLFDSPVAPSLPDSWRGKPVEALKRAAHYYAALSKLHRVHLWSLIRRGQRLFPKK